MALTSETIGEVYTAHHPEASGQGGKRLEERGWGFACNEVTRKAVPVVEPHRLPQLTGLPPIYSIQEKDLV